MTVKRERMLENVIGDYKITLVIKGNIFKDPRDILPKYKAFN